MRQPVGALGGAARPRLGAYLEAPCAAQAALRDPDEVMRQTAIDARDFQPTPPQAA
jgi:hypothetical protein